MSGSKIFKPRFRALSVVVWSAAWLAGCSGGGSDPTAGPASATCDAGGSNCGTVLVSVTDAEGDFASYTVDVLSIQLERANGTVVETLPAATRVDFAGLTELAELISAATLAPGNIDGGRITLDYANAEIFVEAGGEIVPATVVDADGVPLGIVEMTIDLADRERLIVTRGRTHLLQIDFDLAASHRVDTTSHPAIATADPVLVAEVQPVNEKELRVHGALVSADIANATYDVRIRPWFSRVGDHGVVTVRTDSTTSFEIDGMPFTGQAGIDALAAQPAGTLTVAFGTLDLNDREFTAAIVHAGTSVGGELDTVIYGNIVSRAGNQLTVKGATAIRTDGRPHFQRTVIVEIGPDTGVSRRGETDLDLTANDLSVGLTVPLEVSRA